MSKSRLFPLHEFKSNARGILDDTARNARDEWHETIADHARHVGTGTRQRVRLIATGLASRLHDTAEKFTVRGRHAARQTGVRMALLVSGKLITIAESIEVKVGAIQKNR